MTHPTDTSPLTDAPAQACAVGPVPAHTLNIRERLNAVQQANLQRTSALSCSGKAYVGMFFDGTGNNEKADYNNGQVPEDQQKPSNVVRLYYTYTEGKMQATDKFYGIYIPGVGTPFDRVQDAGGLLGKALGAMGERRILWGLLQVFNTISDYLTGRSFLDDGAALAKVLLLEDMLPAERKEVYQGLQTQLMARIAGNFKPQLEGVVLDVFGFSRGAAQVRVWANWLYGLCEQQGPDPRTARYLLAGVPVQIRFMGIFDTVASVGPSGMVAGSVLEFDGHHAWANQQLQIHPAVTHCEHYVAAHEVRASFPCDSVRVEAGYAPHVRESIYPGAHSDVGGGGYTKTSQGKRDGLARIPGMAMYNAALSWGVPLRRLALLKSDFPNDFNNLIPSDDAVAAYQAYLQATGVTGGSLEQQHRAHWAWYLRYRFQAAAAYDARSFVRTASPQARKSLFKTQHDLAQALSRTAVAARAVQALNAPRPGATTPMHTPSEALVLRMVNTNQLFAAPAADQAPIEFAKLRQRLQRDGGMLLRDEHPELDVAALMECLGAPEMRTALPAAVMAFFDLYVHDSVASFADDGIDEYAWNGYGLFKFRRIFFGNRGDAYAVDQAKAENAKLLAQRSKQHA